MIDVLDENGIKTGNILSRQEIHKRGLWHRAIVVAIINEKNEILLQQRSKNKEKNADMWDISVAGHISAGEDGLNSAIREIAEEVGIFLESTTSIQEFKYISSFKESKIYSKDFIENQFYDFFILKKPNLTITDIKMQNSEVQDIKFVNINQLLRMQEDNIIVNRKPVYDMLLDYL